MLPSAGKEFLAVFISTVRTSLTCHSFERRDDEPQPLYWEFLSDPKLLNTAITRAMSLVAVVGDPVSLCTAGDCRGNWRDYIKRCQKHGTLHGVSYDQLKRRIDAPLAKIGLHPEAVGFVPKPVYVSNEEFKSLACATQPGEQSQLDDDSNDDDKNAKSSVSDIEDKHTIPTEKKGSESKISDRKEDLTRGDSTSKDDEGFTDFLQESFEDETVFPRYLDRIIKALVEKVEKTKEKETRLYVTSGNVAFPSLHTATSKKMPETGKSPDKRESKGKASYNEHSSEGYEICVVNGRQEVRLVNLGFRQTPSSRHQRLTSTAGQNDYLDSQLLQQLLLEKPNMYLRCTLRVNSEIVRTAYAEVADTKTPDIKIKGRVRGVFDMDHVVVEKTDFQLPSDDGVSRCQGKIAGEFYVSARTLP